MAARLNPTQLDRTRAAIQATQLVKRLQDHAFGRVDMTRTQVRAVEILLKKVVPDLSSTELAAAPGTVGGFVVFGQAEAASVEAWSESNPPPA